MKGFSRRLGALFAIAIVLGGAFAATPLLPGALAVAPQVAHAQTSGSTKKAGTDTGTPKSSAAIDDSAYGSLMARIMSLFAWLVGAAAVVLDYAAYYGVAQMGCYVMGGNGCTTANISHAIGTTWTILRNVGNILLIFGFLIAGIATIIGLELYGYGSKMLPLLLVAAVFINFSLFISEAVIDVGNLFATEIFIQINHGKLPSPNETCTGADCTLSGSNVVTNEGISNAIMSSVGLQSLYRPPDAKAIEANKNILQNGAWYVGFMAIILFIIASFTMFTLAFLLIARFVALIFLIVIAPIGFAGLVMPKLKSTATKWWTALFEQALTAPVLMLLLYIALAVITDKGFLTGVGTSAAKSGDAGSAYTGFLQATAQGTTQFASILFAFLVAMGLLLAVAWLARRMSSFGAAWATRMGAAASFGAVSVAGRATLGGVGVLAASRRMQALSTPRETDTTAQKYARRLLVRPLVFAGKGARAVRYDVRNAGLGRAIEAGFSAFGAGDLKLGRAGVTPEQAFESEEALRKRYQPGGSYWRESSAAYRQAAEEADFREAQRQMRFAQRELAAGRITQAQYDARIAPYQAIISKNITKMSEEQLTQLTGIKQGVDALVQNLSPKQFEDLMKSKNLSDAEKQGIKAARYRKLSTALDAGDEAGVAAALKTYSNGELAAMPSGLLLHADAAGRQLALEKLTDKQRDFLLESERSAADKKAIRERSPSGRVQSMYTAARDAAIAAHATPAAALMAGGTAIAGTPEFRNLSASQLGKLDKEILLTPPVVAVLTGGALAALNRENKFTPSEMRAVGAAIMGNPDALAHAYVMGPGGAVWR